MEHIPMPRAGAVQLYLVWSNDGRYLLTVSTGFGKWQHSDMVLKALVTVSKEFIGKGHLHSAHIDKCACVCIKIRSHVRGTHSLCMMLCDVSKHMCGWQAHLLMHAANKLSMRVHSHVMQLNTVACSLH